MGIIKLITQINLINYVYYSDVLGVTKLIAEYNANGLELQNKWIRLRVFEE